MTEIGWMILNLLQRAPLQQRRWDYIVLVLKGCRVESQDDPLYGAGSDAPPGTIYQTLNDLHRLGYVRDDNVTGVVTLVKLPEYAEA